MNYFCNLNIAKMETLLETHREYLNNYESLFDRFVDIDWNDRLIGLTGARGVGKTTYLFNHIKNGLGPNSKPLYVSLDDIYFTEHKLVELADQWVKMGGTHLFLDEVHKYNNWSQELKNINDRFKKLYVVFTGSSLLDVLKGQADLSRRSVVHTLNGLSFREFLEVETKQKFPIHTLEEILENHEKLTTEILKKVKPFAFFKDYLQYGYYPFYLESIKSYHRKLMSTLTLMIEVDLPYQRNVEVRYIHKLKKLITHIAHTVPFQPNITKLAGDIETSRQTVIHYLKFLEESKIINLLHSKESSDSHLAKPDKIFLHHPNIMYALNPKSVNEGTLRESFFFNQVANVHKVISSPDSDFLVDDTYTFEIGGKSKKKKQIKNLENAFVVSDNIEHGYGNIIPLWLFGFMY